MLLILCEILAKSTKIVDEHCSFALRASCLWFVIVNVDVFRCLRQTRVFVPSVLGPVVVEIVI